MNVLSSDYNLCSQYYIRILFNRFVYRSKVGKFLLWSIKEDILKEVGNLVTIGFYYLDNKKQGDVSQNIFLCSTENHKGLDCHDEVE